MMKSCLKCKIAWLSKWMARPLRRVSKELSGTTIVESIIAMTIISIAFSVGLMVVEMVLNSNKSAFRYRVKNAVYQQAILTKDNQVYLDEIISMPDFVIEQKISVYQSTPHLFELQLIAKDLNDNPVFEHKELIYVPE